MWLQCILPPLAPFLENTAGVHLKITAMSYEAAGMAQALYGQRVSDHRNRT